MKSRHRILITLPLFLLSCAEALSQCSTARYRIGAPIVAGALNAVGVIPGIDTVQVRHTGSYSSGRPNWWNGNHTYLGKNFSSLAISRGSYFGTGKKTIFKLSIPMDSNHVHIRVSDIRGDGFNAEHQRVQGWLIGVAADSITVTATNLSDFVIVELMTACDLLLPEAGALLQGRAEADGNRSWCNSPATGYRSMPLQRSPDGRDWLDLHVLRTGDFIL